MGTLFDHELMADVFSTSAMRGAFDARATLQAWLDVESALAESQAELGEIPPSAAKHIVSEAKADYFDLKTLAVEILETAHPLVPVIRELSRKCGNDGRYVHWGATTQDIVDTGLMLQCRAGLQLVVANVDGALRALAKHAKEHRGAPMAGRTHAQHALPITIGFKIANWADELLRARNDIAQARRELVGHFAGAVGTLASVGESGSKMRSVLCRRLGLADPIVPWQASRDRLRKQVNALLELAACAERIGNEVVRLQSTEVREMSEPISEHHVGSSTMPQKKNPHISEFMVAGARMMRGAALSITAYGIHLHERDMSSWAIEWMSLPQLFILASGVANHLQNICVGLQIYPDQARANLDMTEGQIMAESVMMRLARHVGHEQAHEYVLEDTRVATKDGRALAMVLKADARVTAHLGSTEIDAALEPASYLGESEIVVDRVVAEIEKVIS